MPQPVNVDLVNVQTEATLVQGSTRTSAPGRLSPVRYDVEDVINDGGDPNAFTDSIWQILQAANGAELVLSVPGGTVARFVHWQFRERVDPLPQYGLARNAPRGDRVYVFDAQASQWLFAAYTGFWYTVPQGRGATGGSGPYFSCGTLSSGFPDYSCFDRLDLPQGTLPAPSFTRFAPPAGPTLRWDPSPVPQNDPAGDISITPQAPPGSDTGFWAIALAIGAALYLGR